MLVVYRFAVTEGETESFSRDAEDALAALASCGGFVRGGLGRAFDDYDDADEAGTAVWMLWTEWNDVGSYRRSLSNFEVKMATPLLSRALPEPSGFEVLAECGPGETPRRTGSDREADPESARREAAR